MRSVLTISMLSIATRGDEHTLELFIFWRSIRIDSRWEKSAVPRVSIQRVRNVPAQGAIVSTYLGFGIC